MPTSDVTFNFCDKTVIVFGGSRGIGKEVCKQFKQSKANVYCASRTNPNIDDIQHLKCDITIEGDIKRVLNTVKNADFVINVAGTNLCQPINKIYLLEWERLMSTNLRSFFIICKESVKIMRPRGGRIVNVSSIAGRHKSIVSGVHYTASKYGIIGLTKQLAHEVSQYNILVNCVCPSQTLTEMLSESMTDEQQTTLAEKIPIRRIALPREQALPILFLCSDAASYITGAALDINGGQL